MNYIRVVALMTVRNEERYLERCLRHLIGQGIEVCVVDNDSTDQTVEIARGYLGKGVVRIERIPYNGYFELETILKNEERLAKEIDADWFMHHDADEIREAPAPYRNLVEGIADVDRQGYNAINFDEFVFVPTREDSDLEPSDYVEEMRYYYFFEAAPQRQVKLWKKQREPVDLASSGGHRVKFRGRRVYPVPFVMRHYIVLSQAHAIQKYGTRDYSPQELARGRHRARARFLRQPLRLPAREKMSLLQESGGWDKSRPYRTHLIFPDDTTLARRILRALGRGSRHFIVSE